MPLHISVEDAGLAGFCLEIPKTLETMALLPCAASVHNDLVHPMTFNTKGVTLQMQTGGEVNDPWLQVPMQMPKTLEESILTKNYWVLL